MRTSSKRVAALLSALAVVAAACGGGGDEREPSAYRLDDTLRLHEVQVLNTHNSYHRRSEVALPPAIADPLDYEHAPLDVQLEDQGVRGFELDIVNKPGDFPVVHLPVVDDETTCTPLTECLRVVEEWSDAHPGHVPVFVLVEPKFGALEVSADPAVAAFDAGAMQRLDEAVRSVLADDDLVTPDDVRGDADTLRAAVVDRGWPTLGEVRGKIVMVLNTSDDERAIYLEGRSSLEGAPMFVTADEQAPSAAVVKVDDPDEARIRRLVGRHFIVRTRADADVVEARVNDTARRELALRSGAQLISTDFPVADPAVNAEYAVQIPGGAPGRCNPVGAPGDCRPRDVEDPEHLRDLG